MIGSARLKFTSVSELPRGPRTWHTACRRGVRVFLIACSVMAIQLIYIVAEVELP
jgi:hypothetical protein